MGICIYITKMCKAGTIFGVYVYIFTCLFTYICIYMNVYMYIYTTRVLYLLSMSIQAYVYRIRFMPDRPNIWYVPACIYLYVDTCMHIYEDIYVYVHNWSQMYVL